MPSTSSLPGQRATADTVDCPGGADEFAALVARVLAEHPDWLPPVLTAVSRGMSRALARAEERAALKDQATLAAMALAKGRVGKDLKETLLARVAAAINPINQCGYERGYIDQYAAISRAEGRP